MSSRLGFGCAPILGRVGRKESLRALAAAYDHGIRHFDVARSYGFGEAEALLGEFLGGKRDHVSITTKFGIVPPRNTRALSFAKSFARNCLKRMPGGRRMVHAASRVALSHRNYEVAHARQCLEQSLRQLRTERIDYYLLHDPPVEALLSDELHQFLDKSVRDGKIGRWGMSIDAEGVFDTPLGQQAQAVLYEANLNVVDRLADTVAQSGGRCRFLSRPYAGGPDALAHAVARPEVRQVVDSLGLNDMSTQQLAMYFALSLAGDDGTVITSMFSESHIRQNVTLADQYEALGERGRQFASRLLSEVGPMSRTPDAAGRSGKQDDEVR